MFLLTSPNGVLYMVKDGGQGGELRSPKRLNIPIMKNSSRQRFLGTRGKHVIRDPLIRSWTRFWTPYLQGIYVANNALLIDVTSILWAAIVEEV